MSIDYASLPSSWLESTDNRHRSSIVTVCQRTHRGKLKRGSVPWTRCFPTQTLVHALGSSAYSSGLTLTCLLLQCRSLKSTLSPLLSLSHLTCLSEDHSAWGLEGAPSREAPSGRELRSKYATSRKFVEKCRVGAREDERPVCVTPSLTFSGKPAVASTRPLF